MGALVVVVVARRQVVLGVGRQHEQQGVDLEADLGREAEEAEPRPGRRCQRRR